MRTIYKFKLRVDLSDSHYFDLPHGWNFIHAWRHHDTELYIWIELDPERPSTLVRFDTILTGKPVPQYAVHRQSVQMGRGIMVHIYSVPA